MDLSIIKHLRETFGDRYVSSNDLFRKSLNTVAVPTMGSTRACLWIITDNARGEDVVRRHYETMLKEDSVTMGIERPIDPYNGPRELAQRLMAQGYHLAITAIPAGFDKKQRYLELKRSEMQKEGMDIQAVCYNLDNIVMPDDKMEIDGVNV